MRTVTSCTAKRAVLPWLTVSVFQKCSWRTLSSESCEAVGTRDSHAHLFHLFPPVRRSSFAAIPIGSTIWKCEDHLSVSHPFLHSPCSPTSERCWSSCGITRKRLYRFTWPFSAGTRSASFPTCTTTARWTGPCWRRYATQSLISNRFHSLFFIRLFLFRIDFGILADSCSNCFPIVTRAYSFCALSIPNRFLEPWFLLS